MTINLITQEEYDLPITKEEITEMLLPLAKELRVLHTKKEELENKKRLLDYEKLYQISNLGNVKSLKREYTCGKGRNVIKGETIISQQINNHGYKYCFLFNGKKYIKYIHILVGTHFIKNDNKKPQINHKDLNKENNNVSNLEWVTNKENTTLLLQTLVSGSGLVSQGYKF